MSVLHVKYLLIGGGAASSHAAQEIRKLDPRGDLLLIGQEISDLGAAKTQRGNLELGFAKRGSCHG